MGDPETVTQDKLLDKIFELELKADELNVKIDKKTEWIQNIQGFLGTRAVKRGNKLYSKTLGSFRYKEESGGVYDSDPDLLKLEFEHFDIEMDSIKVDDIVLQ